MKRLLLVLFLLASPVSAADSKPNIWIITIDDAAVPEMNACLGGGWCPSIKTYLVDQGVFFNRGYVTDSLCCPSRATFLLGQYSHNHGVRLNAYPYGGASLLDDSNTILTALDAAGYRNGVVGRWLNGYGVNENPNSPRDDATYVPAGVEFWKVQSGYFGSGETVYNWRLTSWETGGSVQLIDYGSNPADYNTDVFSSFTNIFLSSADTRPFFLWTTPTAPHTEGALFCNLNNGWTGTIRPAPRHVGSTDSMTVIHTAAFNEADVSDKPAWFSAFPLLTIPQQQCLDNVARHKVASLRAVDDLFAAGRNVLVANGKWDNTVVVFTSDNGYLLGDHRLNAKRWVYEWSIRVPLYVRRLGSTSPLGVSAYSLNMDLAPTILEWAGATSSFVMDGRSLVPLIANPSTSWRRRFLVEATADSGPPNGYNAIRTNGTALSTPNMLYAKYTPSNAVECYTMNTDPDQLLSSSTAPGCSTLASLLPAGVACIGAACRTWEDAP